MAALNLRDRDAVVTGEGIVFRVLGYSHPPEAYICDAEYAPAEIFSSDNAKALRRLDQRIIYKFYEDEGLRLIEKYYPRYYILHDMLGQRVVGVYHSDVASVRKPNERLKQLTEASSEDELMTALNELVSLLVENSSSLTEESFGIFGSMLHGFHHPKFSDLDLTIYGNKRVAELREELEDMYRDTQTLLRNEFETEEPIRGKHWRFRNYYPREYLWHQERKTIYAMYEGVEGRRKAKVEFEPVKEYSEITNEYNPEDRILQKGWVKMFATVKDDNDGPFIPSIYGIEPSNVIHGSQEAEEAVRVVSFMEEFRLQVFKDEKIYIEGNLEEVIASERSFHQIALTYCPRYYEQTLKTTI